MYSIGKDQISIIRLLNDGIPTNLARGYLTFAIIDVNSLGHRMATPYIYKAWQLCNNTRQIIWRAECSRCKDNIELFYEYISDNNGTIFDNLDGATIKGIDFGVECRGKISK